MSGLILVTGATGFIGSHVVNYLLENNIKIRILTRSCKKVENIWGKRKVEIVQGDLSKEETIAGITKNISVVIHIAGIAHSYVFRDRADRERHNLVGTVGSSALLKDCKQNKVKRFIFVSSVKSMGEGSQICLDESSEAEPISSYGKAKLNIEQQLLRYYTDNGIQCAILRLPPVYGKGGRGNINTLINLGISGLMPRLPIIKNKISLVHVSDVVRAIILLLNIDKLEYKIYILTDGKIYSTYDIVDTIYKYLGREQITWRLPMTVLNILAVVADIAENILRKRLPYNTESKDKILQTSYYSSRRIEQELGYSAKYTVEKYIKELARDKKRPK